MADFRLYCSAIFHFPIQLILHELGGIFFLRGENRNLLFARNILPYVHEWNREVHQVFLKDNGHLKN
jgi:hypothetical protein